MKHSGCALAVLLLCLLAHQAACGKTYILGGNTAGWTNKADIDYNDWLSSIKIKVGDSLSFVNHDTTDHTVVDVSKLAYDTCGTSGYMEPPTTISPGISVSFTFYMSGQLYFICTMPGHCVQGMKVAVEILNADGSVNQTAAAADAPKANSAPPVQWNSQILVATFFAAVTVFAYLT